MANHPYDENKDPVYQSLLGAQGWAKRAEDLLYAEKVDVKEVARALNYVRNCANNALVALFEFERKNKV